MLIEDLATLEVTAEVDSFATELVESGVLPRKASVDATHIAIAALSRMDFLMTWNCVHIANATISKRIALMCNERGLESPVICTPAELMGE
jgi:hypothetical protein